MTLPRVCRGNTDEAGGLGQYTSAKETETNEWTATVRWTVQPGERTPRWTAALVAERRVTKQSTLPLRPGSPASSVTETNVARRATPYVMARADCVWQSLHLQTSSSNSSASVIATALCQLTPNTQLEPPTPHSGTAQLDRVLSTCSTSCGSTRFLKSVSTRPSAILPVLASMTNVAGCGSV